MNKSPREYAKDILSKVRATIKDELDSLDEDVPRGLVHAHVLNHLSRSCFEYMQVKNKGTKKTNKK